MLARFQKSSTIVIQALCIEELKNDKMFCCRDVDDERNMQIESKASIRAQKH